MTEVIDIMGLLRRKGRVQSSSGVSQVYLSQIANGHRRAGAAAIAKIASEIGVSTEEVCAACDESWRRAHAGDLAPAPGGHDAPPAWDAK